MTLHPTRDEAARLDTDGRVVLFRAGELPARWNVNDERHGMRPGPRPPAEFVEAAKPCETCTPHRPGSTVIDDCPDCIGGKRRIAAVVPCSNRDACAAGDDSIQCVCTTLNGTVTVATVVVEWGPLVVLPANEPLGADDGNWLEVFGTALIRYQDHDQVELVRPDTDPQSLVGQWAIGVKVVD